MENILVLVDCQKDFMDRTGALYVSGAEGIKENIVGLVNSQKWDKIIITKDTHTAEEYEKSEEHLKFKFPLHCEIGTKGHDLFDELRKTLNSLDLKNETIIIVEKPVFDVWAVDKFQTFVKSQLNSDDKLTICGVATNYCVYFAVNGFIKNGFNNITVPRMCVKAIQDDTESIVSEQFEKWGV